MHAGMMIDEICRLQSDIMDVNQIFKDLSVLVHEQGDIVGESCLRSGYFY